MLQNGKTSRSAISDPPSTFRYTANETMPTVCPRNSRESTSLRAINPNFRSGPPSPFPFPNSHLSFALATRSETLDRVDWKKGTKRSENHLPFVLDNLTMNPPFLVSGMRSQLEKVDNYRQSLSDEDSGYDSPGLVNS